MQIARKPMRNTQQRRLVLDVVMTSTDHPVADDIYIRARQTDPTISKGTVYRNLNVLSELGEIRRLSMPMGPDHFDFNTTNHYHFICKNCLKVSDTEIPYIHEINGEDLPCPGYKTEFHRLVLVGECPECRGTG